MTYRELWTPLTAIYPEGEAKAIARMVLETSFGLSMVDILSGRTADDGQLSAILQRLLKGEPVQYVVGTAEFGGRDFHVEPGVLIPRPETLELCRLITEDAKGRNTVDGSHEILDIGTGSGCIAITLALDIPNSHVTAWDISPTALRIVRDNARRLSADVSVKEVNILSESALDKETVRGGFTCIVSNPPYICEQERADMERNVLDYEPELALFVPDNDPLLFYRAIARYAAVALKPEGQLYFELNARYAAETADMLHAEGFARTEVYCDQFGKERFIKACRS